MEESRDKAKQFDWAKLVLGKQIASGGYGVVFQGRYDGQKVAVKVIGEGKEDSYAVTEATISYLREVSTWVQLDHPNVARFIVAKEDIKPPSKKLKKGGCCVVSEYLKGGTLASYVRHHKKLAFIDKIQLALDVARGLSYLHSKKIVHRDIKLENLLLNDQKRVKIIDFGISRTEDSDLAEMSVNVGTKGYIAPEVLTSSSYNHRCDVFSFGICLWEIYYQKRVGSTFASFTPQIGDDCPENFADLMRSCWMDPQKRPEMAEVVKTLEDMLKTAKEEDKGSHRRYQIGCFSFLKGC